MIEQAKNICIELLRKVKKPSSPDINKAIDDVLKIFPALETDRETLFNYLSAIFSVFSEDYRILDTDDGYIPWLKDNKANIPWNFWNRYISYLQKKIAPDTINKLDNLTDDILDRIANPATLGAWDKRGMVVGQVQSGKTSNYTGLINKASDAGYKLIIVLAGMHDSLRSQTQIRIDEGFLGFNSQRSLQYSNTNKIGVGFYNPIDEKTRQQIDLPANALTSSHLNGDFNRKVAQSAGIHLRSSDPIIAVVKKNGSILKNLISWLAVWGDKQPDGKIIIRNVPFLLIDDEADNASINVSKEKVSAINGCIRALLSLFEQSAYVGYTATPFANIFIPIQEQESIKGLDLTIKDYEYTVGQDLFPKDFIINIPAPSNYIGPAKVFGLPALTSSDTNEDPLPVIRLVKDYETFNASNTQEQFQNLVSGVEHEFAITKSLVPDKHKKNDPLPEELPNSLKYAVKCFVLSTAARRVRKQIDVHNSMLIHISRFIVWQDRIATLVDAELKFYQKQIELKSGNLLKELEVIWKKEFLPTTTKIIRDSNNETSSYKDPEIAPITWKEVEVEIYSAISKMEVRAVHGDKNVAGLSHHNISPLDYFFSEQQGKFLSVIAVGGDKLSRGLTLEGLTVSYYLRASKMYDTLMQMGRWFGYRPGYVDLCRIFTSDELTRWYKHITIASEEMRRDFDYMFLLKKTPKEFGLKVRTHPGVLKITAANKFRYKKIMYLSYSGELEQTYQFKIDKDRFKKNFDAVIDLISALGTPLPEPLNDCNKKQKFVWQAENNFNTITSFLLKYKIGEEVIDVNKIVDYINAQTKKGNLINWTVALINNSTAKSDEEFSFSGISDKVGLTDRTNISSDSNDYEVAKYNITDHRHELIDLSLTEVALAKAQTEADYKEEGKKEVPELPSRKRIKWKRESKNGLLLIYPLNNNCQRVIDDASDPKTTERKLISDVPVIGIAISFPEIENDEKIEYAVNEQFRKEYEYPEELDLTDEPMNRIKEIWAQLEDNGSAGAGLFKLRYSETSKCDVFLGIKFPEAHCMLIIRAPFAIGKDFNFKYEFRGLKFDKIYDPFDSKFLLLNLVLVDKQFKDVFDTLVADVLTAVINESDIKVILKNYSNRLIKWQSLFERFKQQGLTPEEQRGLFGELFFMRRFLHANSDFKNVLISWIGSAKQIRDYQFGRWSVEVKTTHGNNHQKVHISSERQLDPTNLDNLFLNHLSLETRQQSGETLNQMVDAVTEILSSDFTALTQFRNKLIEAGFFDQHRNLYSDIGYFIRQDVFYKVENSFPRIEERDIRSGVGDVKYSIMVSLCSDFSRTEEEVFKTLIFV